VIQNPSAFLLFGSSLGEKIAVIDAGSSGIKLTVFSNDKTNECKDDNDYLSSSSAATGRLATAETTEVCSFLKMFRVSDGDATKVANVANLVKKLGITKVVGFATAGNRIILPSVDSDSWRDLKAGIDGLRSPNVVTKGMRTLSGTEEAWYEMRAVNLLPKTGKSYAAAMADWVAEESYSFISAGGSSAQIGWEIKPAQDFQIRYSAMFFNIKFLIEEANTNSFKCGNQQELTNFAQIKRILVSDISESDVVVGSSVTEPDSLERDILAKCGNAMVAKCYAVFSFLVGESINAGKPCWIKTGHESGFQTFVSSLNALLIQKKERGKKRT